VRIAVVSAAVLAVAAFACTSARADFDGNVNFFLGAKSLDSNEWNPNDSQVEFGAVMSFGQKDWPVQIAGDVLISVDETTEGVVKTTGATFEFDPGVRWLILKKGTVFPYIGGGIGIIGGAVEVENNFVSVDAADASLGFWTDAGVFFRLGSNFNIGLDLRYSTADIDLDFGGGLVANDVNAGGFSFGLLMGFGW
jgi:outer membrane protein W